MGRVRRTAKAAEKTVRMRNERNGQVVFARTLPAVVARWRALGYVVDTDRPGFVAYDEARANHWGRPNRWERKAVLDVIKKRGK